MFKEGIEIILAEINELKEKANFCEMIGDRKATERIRKTVIVKAIETLHCSTY